MDCPFLRAILHEPMVLIHVLNLTEDIDDIHSVAATNKAIYNIITAYKNSIINPQKILQKFVSDLQPLKEKYRGVQNDIFISDSVAELHDDDVIIENYCDSELKTAYYYPSFYERKSVKIWTSTYTPDTPEYAISNLRMTQNHASTTFSTSLSIGGQEFLRFSNISWPIFADDGGMIDFMDFIRYIPYLNSHEISIESSNDIAISVTKKRMVSTNVLLNHRITQIFNDDTRWYAKDNVMIIRMPFNHLSHGFVVSIRDKNKSLKCIERFVLNIRDSNEYFEIKGWACWVNKLRPINTWSVRQCYYIPVNLTLNCSKISDLRLQIHVKPGTVLNDDTKIHVINIYYNIARVLQNLGLMGLAFSR